MWSVSWFLFFLPHSLFPPPSLVACSSPHRSPDLVAGLASRLNTAFNPTMRPSTRHRMRDCCFESKAHDLELAIKLYRRQTALNKANYLRERCEQRRRHQCEERRLKAKIAQLELTLAVNVGPTLLPLLTVQVITALPKATKEEKAAFDIV